MLFGIMKCLEKDQANIFVWRYAIFIPHVAISGDVANRVKKFVPCVQTEWLKDIQRIYLTLCAYVGGLP